MPSRIGYPWTFGNAYCTTCDIINCQRCINTWDSIGTWFDMYGRPRKDMVELFPDERAVYAARRSVDGGYRGASSAPFLTPGMLSFGQSVRSIGSPDRATMMSPRPSSARPAVTISGASRNASATAISLPFQVVNTVLRVANFSNQHGSLDQTVPRFLPSRWYSFRIRKGRGQQWTQLAFPNVMAQDVLDTCSESPGRKLYRVVETPGRWDEESSIDGQSLGKSILQLVTEAGGEPSLMLMVLDA